MKKNIALLLGILFGFLLASLFTSCKKEEITLGNYTLGNQPSNTNNWQTQYSNGGVVPNWGGSGSVPNEVVGTRWVLTYLQVGLATPPLPVDTIYFVDNVNYTINSGSYRTYQLSNGVTTSSKTLTLNYHFPFGSGNYSGEVAPTFVSDGVILNCEFHNTNTTTTTVRASFLKI